MTIREYTQLITQTLQPLYDPREAAAVAKAYMGSRLQMPAYQLALSGDEVLTAEQILQFDADLAKLKSACPLQYVLESAEFYGMDFKVNPSVLIPRPETEELVSLVVQQCAQRDCPNVWDLGTGSGCIAVAVATQVPNAHVFATDLSASALSLAQENARQLNAKVTFACHDMRDVEHLPFALNRFDVLVSNPPYIPQRVRGEMHPNVVEHEPDMALFVPDENPLLFYEALADLGTKVLKHGGCMLMETYEDFHQELMDLFCSKGYVNGSSMLDINGKKRMFYVLWP